MPYSKQSETQSTMEEETALKLKVLSYRNLPAERSMIEYRPHPQAIQQTVLPRQSRAGSIGRFSTLPLEIIDRILDHLDFQSLENVLRINYSCQGIVKSLPAYKDMVVYASGTVKALTITGLIGHFTAGQLHATLRTDRCEGCNRFGPFLFLLTCTRRCYFCMYRDPQFRIMTVSAAEACFGLSRGNMQQLPILKTSPLLYAQDLLRKSQQLSLVSFHETRALGIAAFGSEENMTGQVQKAYAAKCSDYDQRIAAWSKSRDGQDKKPRRPQSLTDCTISQWEIASAPFPTLNFRNRSIQWGVSCQGCADDYRFIHQAKVNDLSLDEEFRMGLIERGNRCYSEEEFLEHLEECDAAQGMWNWRLLPTVEAGTQ